ncbi:dienelactone hydrolase [Sphingosinicella sp. CPCC 101087]|uniref:alpha/beta hydrolase family protein n=1 Tax=Sphingosinicella sp. CPCC 101087 TaxID=2497754 RepID=UPI00101D80E6|nr:dienelactone hydrolase [Sphingosinicella sp. CPCC 101087]
MRSTAYLFIVSALLVGWAAPAAADPTMCDAVWSDAARGRDVPVRIRMPGGNGQVPLILFSHGLGGSLDSGRAWSHAWAEAGFAVVNLQHPGSDRSVIGGGRLGLIDAMSPSQLVERTRDARFVIAAIGRQDREGACDLRRIDTERIGMAGHSYGAHTTQALAGQRFAGGSNGDTVEPRIRAAVAFSPSPPFRRSSEAAFADVRIPFFSVTGTEDIVPFLPGITPADRERPFRAMPPGGKYLLVLSGADHMAFNGGGDGRPEPGPHVAELVVAATTDFWRWTLSDDVAARLRLDRLEQRLAPEDRFERR